MADEFFEKVKAGIDERFAANKAEAESSAEPEPLVEEKPGESPLSMAPLETEESEEKAPEPPPGKEPVEPPVVAADEEEESEDPEPGKTPKDWITAEVKETAAFYGIPEAELADFASQAEFDKATTYAARAMGRSSPPPAAPGHPAPQGSSAASEGAPTAPAPTATPKSLAEQAKEAGYDDFVVKMAERQDAMDAREAQRAQADQQRQQADLDRNLRSLHESLSRIDADRYGKLVDDAGRPLAVGKESMDRFARTVHMADAMIIAARNAGRPDPSFDVLAREADRAEFSRENAERDKKRADAELVERVRKQSKRRLGGTTAPPATKPVHKGRLSENPELLSRVRKEMDENG